MKDNPNHFRNVVAGLFLTGFAFFVLKELQSVLLPLFIAVMLSFVFLPMYDFLVGKKFPSFLAILIIVILVIIITDLLGVCLVMSIKTFSAEFPRYELKFIKIYEDVISFLRLSKEDTENLNKLLDLKKLLMEGKLTSAITGIFSGIANLFGNYILIMFYIIFTLSEINMIRKKIAVAFSEERRMSLTKVLPDIIDGFKGYISGKTILSLIESAIIGIFLAVCGVDFYITWASLFFIGYFIPNVGSLIVSILVTLVMLLQFGNILIPVAILAGLILIQNIMGNIIEPKVFGRRFDLSPLLLFFSVIFWGYIWGLAGVILSVPIMSMIKIILMNIPEAKPYAILMSNSAKKI